MFNLEYEVTYMVGDTQVTEIADMHRYYEILSEYVVLDLKDYNRKVML